MIKRHNLELRLPIKASCCDYNFKFINIILLKYNVNYSISRLQ